MKFYSPNCDPILNGIFSLSIQFHDRRKPVFLFSMKGGDVDKKVMFSHKKEGKG